MVVAIFGSSRFDTRPAMEHRDEFRGFCTAVGKAIASVPYTILRVASDRENTADRWVVEGFAEVANPPDGRVEVYPRDGKSPFPVLDRRRPGLIVRPTVPSSRRAVTAHLRMLDGADAALLVGGKHGVTNAGLAALLAKVRVWPVGYFGGAAREFLTASESIADMSMSVPDRETAQNLNSSAAAAAEVVSKAIHRFPRVMIVHGTSDHRKDVAKILENIGLSQVYVLVDLTKPGEIIAQQFERYASMSDAAVAVLSPDDFVVDPSAPPGIGAATPVVATTRRARQNVLLECGWFWARLGLDRTLLLDGGVEMPSDLGGVVVAKYVNRPADARDRIEAFVHDVRFGAARQVR